MAPKSGILSSIGSVRASDVARSAAVTPCGRRGVALSAATGRSKAPRGRVPLGRFLPRLAGAFGLRPLGERAGALR